MYWIAYVGLGLMVGSFVGYVKGHKHGYAKGWDARLIIERTAHQLRGQKAAATRKAKVIP